MKSLPYVEAAYLCNNNNKHFYKPRTQSEACYIAAHCAKFESDFFFVRMCVRMCVRACVSSLKETDVSTSSEPPCMFTSATNEELNKGEGKH